MSEKSKFLLIVAVCVLIFGVGLFYFGRKPSTDLADLAAVDSTTQNKNNSSTKDSVPVEKVNIEELESTYRTKAKTIVSNYFAQLEADKLTNNQVKDTKSQLLSLRVSDKYKEIHLNLILALAEMEKFFQSGDIKEKEASQKIVKDIITNNAWLN